MVMLNVLFCILVFLAYIVLRTLCDILEVRITKHWPAIDAIITQCKLVLEETAGDLTPYLKYSYRINGVAYTGSVRLREWTAKYRSAFSGPQELVGKRIRVRYDPLLPDKSFYLLSIVGQMPLISERGLVSRLIWLSRWALAY
jgi:hypothetical protein